MIQSGLDSIRSLPADRGLPHLANHGRGMATSKLLTDDIRQVTYRWLQELMPEQAGALISLGLPEWDDRLDLWRVALVSVDNPSLPLGEVQVDQAGAIRLGSAPDIVAERLRNVQRSGGSARHSRRAQISFPPIPSKIILGDCRKVLRDFPPDSIQLVLTSPPYFNAKPECTEYVDYQSYLDFLGEAFSACHAVLAEGRFLIVNVSPVLVRRTSRKHGKQAAADSL